jgi:hypothetical protein
MWPRAVINAVEICTNSMTAILRKAVIQKPELWRKKKLLGGTDRPSFPLDSRPAPIALKCSTANKRKLLDAEC